MREKRIKTFLFCLIVSSPLAFADSVNINNNNNNGQPTSNCDSSIPQPDPRQLPEGSYNYQNGDGSGSQVYTTGPKQPFIPNNACGNTSTAPVQPIVTLPSRR